MFNPSGDSRGRIHQLGSSQPDNRELQPGGTSLSSCPARYRERSAESSGSSHATPASPSARTGSSSCGSRHALGCSSAHREPCRPSPEPGMTPAAGPAHRIGDSTSLLQLYLSNMLFRPESTLPVSLERGTRNRGNKPRVVPTLFSMFSADWMAKAGSVPKSVQRSVEGRVFDCEYVAYLQLRSTFLKTRRITAKIPPTSP